MRRLDKEIIKSLFRAGGTLSLSDDDLLILNQRADRQIKRREPIREYCQFVYDLVNYRRSVRLYLMDVFQAFHKFDSTENAVKSVNNICRRVENLPFKEQNKMFVELSLPAIVRYCKAIK